MKTDVNFLRRPSRRDLVLSFKQLSGLLVVILLLMVVHYQYQLSNLSQTDASFENGRSDFHGSPVNVLTAPQWMSRLRVAQEQMSPALLSLLQRLVNKAGEGLQLSSVDADLNRQTVRISWLAGTREALTRHVAVLAESDGRNNIQALSFAAQARGSAWQGRAELRFIQVDDVVEGAE